MWGKNFKSFVITIISIIAGMKNVNVNLSSTKGFSNQKAFDNLWENSYVPSLLVFLQISIFIDI